MNEIDNFRLKAKMNILTDLERDVYIKMIEKNIDVRDKNLGFLMSWRKSVGRRYVLALVCSLWLFFYAISHTDMHWYIIAAIIVSIFFVIIYCIRLCFINRDMKSNQFLVLSCDLDWYQEELKRLEILREEQLQKDCMRKEIQIIEKEFQERLNDDLKLVVRGEKLSQVLAEYGFHNWAYKQYLDKLTSNIRQSIVSVKRISQKEMQQCANVDDFRKILDEICNKYRLKYKLAKLDEWLLSFDDWFVKYQEQQLEKCQLESVSFESDLCQDKSRYDSNCLSKKLKVVRREVDVSDGKEEAQRQADLRWEEKLRRQWWRRFSNIVIVSQDHIFTPEQIFDIRSKHYGNVKAIDFKGCYILFNKTRDMYYVGQSKTVLARVSRHFKGKGNGDVYADYKRGHDEFEICLVSLAETQYERLNTLEKSLIRATNARIKGYNRTNGNA